jgi:4-amino-4-deoxychorismate lyase
MLLETLQLCNGAWQNLPCHQARLNRSGRETLGWQTDLNLAEHLAVPPGYERGVFRGRLLADASGVVSLTLMPYVPKQIKTLALAERPALTYPHKWADRQAFAELLAEYPTADEVIITHNGYLTDTTIANIALFDGSQWFTPARPLLPGTRRAQLLNAGQLTEAAIHVRDLPDFQHICLINVFRELSHHEALPVTTIFQ